MGKHPAQPGVTVTVTQIGEAGEVVSKKTINTPAEDRDARIMFDNMVREVELAQQVDGLLDGWKQ